MKVTVPLIAVAAASVPSALSFCPHGGSSVSPAGMKTHVVNPNVRTTKKRTRPGDGVGVAAAPPMLSSVVANEEHKQSTEHYPKSSSINTHFGSAGYHILHPEVRARMSSASTEYHQPSIESFTGYHKSSLSTTTIGMTYDLTVDEFINIFPEQSMNVGSTTVRDLMDIVSAALLITGNTVGAGTMVLPEIAAGPGLGMSTALIAGIYGVNLISGLLLAEVAIKQHESSGGEVPSSFKEFADASLQSATFANGISAMSVFVNWCVLSFALTRSGELASTLLPTGLGPILSAAGVATVLTGVVGTQTNQSLSRVASAAVTVLFATFAGLLIPGLASVHDPVGALFAPGTSCSGDVACALSKAAPIFLSTMIYQNIVPSVTKLLQYDRQKTSTAIIIGSAIPGLMYPAFNLSVLGGGLDASVSGGSPILTTFMVASLTGSCIAGTMSLSEEFENALFNTSEDDSPSDQDQEDSEGAVATVTSLPSVLMAVVPPLLAGSVLASSGGATAALDIAGGYCSPILYGVLPVVMVAKQRIGDNDTQNSYGDATPAAAQSLVPGGFASLGLLSVTSTGFILQKLISDVGDFASSMGLA